MRNQGRVFASHVKSPEFNPPQLQFNHKKYKLRHKNQQYRQQSIKSSLNLNSESGLSILIQGRVFASHVKSPEFNPPQLQFNHKKYKLRHKNQQYRQQSIKSSLNLNSESGLSILIQGRVFASHVKSPEFNPPQLQFNHKKYKLRHKNQQYRQQSIKSSLNLNSESGLSILIQGRVFASHVKSPEFNPPQLQFNHKKYKLRHKNQQYRQQSIKSSLNLNSESGLSILIQ
ncbi:hypothetical protein OUZ56_009759 [Daphnia magna]|uniref:Uncharacterized protein n=1 Tax=Daphnia magna TaxID=35525 RepID=A0ABR0AGV8_9CRUS|nr:hypothetical protein OUZ56_009759 [Daphnia magna]